MYGKDGDVEMTTPKATPVRSILRLPHIADVGGTSECERPVTYVDLESFVGLNIRGDPDLPGLLSHTNFVEFVEVRKLDEGDQYRFGDDPEDKALFDNFNKYYDNIKSNIRENAPELWVHMKDFGPGKMVRQTAPVAAEAENEVQGSDAPSSESRKQTLQGIIRGHSSGDLGSPASTNLQSMPPPSTLPPKREQREKPPPPPPSDTDDAMSLAAEDLWLLSVLLENSALSGL